MARNTATWLQPMTLLLMAITYAAVEVASDPDGIPSAFGLIFGAVAFPVAWVIGRVLTRGVPPSAWVVGRFLTGGVVSSSSCRALPRWVTGVLCLLLIGPVLMEPLLRSWTGQGLPLELQMVYGLRNFGIGLAALAAWPLYLRLSGVVSLFLMLFVAAMGDQKPIPWFLAAYAVVGSLWLMLAHTQRFGQVEPTTAATTRIARLMEQTRLWVPWRELALVMGLLVATVVVWWLGPRQTVLTLWELVPTSGGTGATDVYARQGVGDGPEEVAGDNARAAGMVETDKLIEDNKNALIDLVNDMYGPPHRPPNEQERMVAGGRADIIAFHGRLPENRRPSRHFDTSRRGPPPKRKLESLHARALFEVEGRTPLHIRQMVFERYDAGQRRWVEASRPTVKSIEPIGGDWMQIRTIETTQPWYCENERHRFKLAEPDNNLIPTPPLLQRFRIHRVDRADYYCWAYDGVLAFVGRQRLPPGIVIHTDCRTVDPARLPEHAYWRQLPMEAEALTALREVPDPWRTDLERLAYSWVGEESPGWPQITAILDRLRNEYTLDPSATPPAEHPAPVLWFLQESRRGPDYLFATAAALLLRSLGYATRVCLGYYADPDAYDRHTGHTPVRAADLHTWSEVMLRDGQWLVVEPTPGYEVLAPRLPWTERVYALLRAGFRWAADHPMLLTVLVGVGITAVLLRRRLIDSLLVLHWQLMPAASWQRMVLRCLRLMERRCRWCGHARAPSQTLTRWLGSLREVTPEDGPRLSLFICIAEQAAYAPHLPAPLPLPQLRTLCRQTLHAWSWSRLRRRIPERNPL